jgi:predicted  nucleic acid-binding Zn-ribbon protein
MAQLQAILNYQEIDKKLYKLERDLAASEERKEYLKLKKFLESAPEKLDSLEVKAASLAAEVETLEKKYAQVEATLSDFENLEELVKSGADISFYKKKAQTKVEQLKKIKAEINTLTASIKATDAEYQKLKKQVIAAQKQYPEVSEKYKAVKSAQDTERKEIEKALAAAAAEVAPEMLAKYQTKRKEKLFPIVGELYSGRCPFCSMEPPLAAKSKLKDGIECDNCHRIIFEK